MKDETLAIHFGYETDPTTKSVATPIYQTVRMNLITPSMARICLTLKYRNIYTDHEPDE